MWRTSAVWRIGTKFSQMCRIGTKSSHVRRIGAKSSHLWKIGIKSSHVKNRYQNSHVWKTGTKYSHMRKIGTKISHIWRTGSWFSHMSATKLWRIECKMQQIWGYFINVRNAHVCYMHIWKFAYFSQSVRYWYEICDVVVPIFHVLWELVPILHSVKFTKCEICGSTAHACTCESSNPRFLGRVDEVKAC